MFRWFQPNRWEKRWFQPGRWGKNLPGVKPTSDSQLNATLSSLSNLRMYLYIMWLCKRSNDHLLTTTTTQASPASGPIQIWRKPFRLDWNTEQQQHCIWGIESFDCLPYQTYQAAKKPNNYLPWVMEVLTSIRSSEPSQGAMAAAVFYTSALNDTRSN